MALTVSSSASTPPQETASRINIAKSASSIFPSR
jgi:hypothetical protein